MASRQIKVPSHVGDRAIQVIEQAIGERIEIVLLVLPPEGGIPAFVTSLLPMQMESVVKGCAEQIRRGGKRTMMIDQVTIDPRTGRPLGDHGTANQAIEFALDHMDVGDIGTDFLRCWRTGDLEEWSEFYEWLKKQERG